MTIVRQPRGHGLRAPLLALVALTAFAEAAYATEAKFKCSSGTQVHARFSGPGVTPGFVVLTIAGAPDQIRLPQVLSADGGRYAEGDIEFWVKGRGATLTRRAIGETCETD